MEDIESVWREKTRVAKDQGIQPSAKMARLTKERYYLGNCKRHGEILMLTCDNSCPLCVRAARKIRTITNPTFNRARSHYNEIKKRSVEKGFEFDLELDWFREQVLATDTCPVLNVPIASKAIVRDEFSISVDRFDNDKGYTVENVRFISDRANRIKNYGTAEEHLLVVKYMVEDPAVEQLIDELLNQLQSK